MAFALHKSWAFQVLMGFHISICQTASAALCVRADDIDGGLRSTMVAAMTVAAGKQNICNSEFFFSVTFGKKEPQARLMAKYTSGWRKIDGCWVM